MVVTGWFLQAVEVDISSEHCKYKEKILVQKPTLDSSPLLTMFHTLSYTKPIILASCSLLPADQWVSAILF